VNTQNFALLAHLGASNNSDQRMFLYAFSASTIFSMLHKCACPGTTDDAMVGIWAQFVKKACYKNTKK